MPPTLLQAVFASLLAAQPATAPGISPQPWPTQTVVRVTPAAAAPAAATPFEASPFAGNVPFVGHGLVPDADEARFEVGVAGQVVPLNLVLTTTRGSLVDASIASACASSSSAACEGTAAAYTDQALDVIGGLSDGQWSEVLAASRYPALLTRTLKSVGVTDAAELKAVQSYVKTVPAADRQEVLSLARHLAAQPAGVHLEPFATAIFRSVRLRLGVPVAAGSSSTLGNVNLDAATGWTFPTGPVDLGLTVGLETHLPTSGNAEHAAVMADLFQAPRFLWGTLTLAPYVVGGLDSRWVAWQVHADLWVQAGVRGDVDGSNADVLQYGTALTLGSHAPVSLIGQLEGLEGLHHADAYRSLFVVTGLQARLWALTLGVAAQVPVVDRAAEDLGSYGGVALSSLAKYTVLARTSASF